MEISDLGISESLYERWKEKLIAIVIIYAGTAELCVILSEMTNWQKVISSVLILMPTMLVVKILSRLIVWDGCEGFNSGVLVLNNNAKAKKELRRMHKSGSQIKLINFNCAQQVIDKVNSQREILGLVKLQEEVKVQLRGPLKTEELEYVLDLKSLPLWMMNNNLIIRDTVVKEIKHIVGGRGNVPFKSVQYIGEDVKYGLGTGYMLEVMRGEKYVKEGDSAWEVIKPYRYQKRLGVLEFMREQLEGTFLRITGQEIKDRENNVMCEETRTQLNAISIFWLLIDKTQEVEDSGASCLFPSEVRKKMIQLSQFAVPTLREGLKSEMVKREENEALVVVSNYTKKRFINRSEVEGELSVEKKK